MRPDNRQHLSARGVVFYLACSAEKQYERTYRDRNRPLLQTENPKETLSKLITQREPWYREVADLIFDTQRKNTGSSAHTLQKLLSRINK